MKRNIIAMNPSDAIEEAQKLTGTVTVIKSGIRYFIMTGTTEIFQWEKLIYTGPSDLLTLKYFEK